MTKRIFSGVQPTGNLHLGNYLGAIKQWVAIQHDYESIFCIVDSHAITVHQTPDELRKNTLMMAATYIAAGINPKNSIIYNQSSVNQHTELAWILGCNTPLGWLNRMTQFKEKAGKKRDNAVLGLYSYPVLMAADILLFDTTEVPVGDDQKQHIELTREIALSFNSKYQTEAFVIPEPKITETATRVMSLRNGLNKMSKSDESDASRINLTDSADVITQKIRKSKTDMGFDGIYFDKENRPEISNLLTIFAALDGVSIKEVTSKVQNFSNAEFKDALTDVVVSKLVPITEEIRRLENDQGFLMATIAEGAEKARILAEKKVSKIKQIVGFI